MTTAGAQAAESNTVELPEPTVDHRVVINLGAGDTGPDRLHPHFRAKGWQELRVDIDPKVRPDIVASLDDLSAIDDASADAIWCSHALEHLEAHRVSVALAEFARILKTNGYAILTMPDLQRVAALIAEDRGDEVLYTAPVGPITAHDMVFGHGASIAAGRKAMAHRTGFTPRTLGHALIEAGFATAKVKRGERFDLWAIAYRSDSTQTSGDLPDFRSL